jgi:hypothetical protein
MTQLVDARDRAPKLAVTPTTILTWARRGGIPCLRAGRRPGWFDLAEGEHALKERAQRGEVSHAG